jgi:hypothetical protein
VPKTFGRTDDFGGVTIFTPADTGFNAQAVPLNNTNSGVAFLGPIMDLSAFNRVVLYSHCTPATACRAQFVTLDENDAPLFVVDDSGIISVTLQQGNEIQDVSSPQALAGVARVKLAVYGLAAAGVCTIRLFCKNRF